MKEMSIAHFYRWYAISAISRSRTNCTSTIRRRQSGINVPGYMSRIQKLYKAKATSRKLVFFLCSSTIGENLFASGQ